MWLQTQAEGSVHKLHKLSVNTPRIQWNIKKINNNTYMKTETLRPTQTTVYWKHSTCAFATADQRKKKFPIVSRTQNPVHRQTLHVLAEQRRSFLIFTNNQFECWTRALPAHFPLSTIANFLLNQKNVSFVRTLVGTLNLFCAIEPASVDLVAL